MLAAAVLAAGEGRRLRPLTEHRPKAVLPIDGRPVLSILLRELASAGIRRVTLVVGRLGEQVEALAGDGSGFGLAVRYARQSEPLGSADALRCALATGARAPLLACAADTVFRPGDIAGAVTRWLASGAAGGLAVRPVPPDELPARSSVRTEDGRVLEVVEKPGPDIAPAELAGAPLWFLGRDLLPFLDGLPGPPFELATAFQRGIDAGHEVAAIEVGPTRDLTRPEDLLRENFPYLSRK